jgi:hypothetical protein
MLARRSAHRRAANASESSNPIDDGKAAGGVSVRGTLVWLLAFFLASCLSEPTALAIGHGGRVSLNMWEEGMRLYGLRYDMVTQRVVTISNMAETKRLQARVTPPPPPTHTHTHPPTHPPPHPAPRTPYNAPRNTPSLPNT